MSSFLSIIYVPAKHILIIQSIESDGLEKCQAKSQKNLDNDISDFFTNVRDSKT